MTDVKGLSLSAQPRLAINRPNAFVPLFRGNDEDIFEKNPEQKPSAALKPLVSTLSFFFLNPSRVSPMIPYRLDPFLKSSQMKKFDFIQPVDFKSLDDKTLKGYWIDAEGDPNNKTIILGHGYYAASTMMVSLADKIKQRGWNVFMFDFRGHGKSEHGWLSIGYNEARDVAAAVDFVKTNKPDKSNLTAYLGHSMGANALMYAPESLKDEYPDALEKLTEQLDAIVLDSPYSHLDIPNHPVVKRIASWKPKKDGLKNLYKPVSGLLNYVRNRLIPEFEVNSPNLLSIPKPIQDYRPLEIFRGHPISFKPTLLMHGNKDCITPYHQGLEIKKGLEGRRHHLRFVELNADHRCHKWQAFPEHKHCYNQVLRDEETYLNNLFWFLGG